MHQHPLDPTEAFAALGRIKLSETDLSGVLSQISELAPTHHPGCRRGIRDAGARHRCAHRRVHRRHRPRPRRMAIPEGPRPCVDAAQAAVVVSVPDTVAEERWPDWAARARAAGGYSSLSIGLPIQEAVVGALNVYGTKSDAFDADAIALAQTFAGYAAVALANANLYDTTASLAHHMQAAMESRAVIEQAKGIVMAERRCTADDAFAVLVKISQDTNRKLRDVAIALVERAAQPPR